MPSKNNTPAIRFAGFTGEWEKRKLGEIAEIEGGGTPSTLNPEYWDGDIDWYTPAEMEGLRYATGSTRKISQMGLLSSSAKILPTDRTILFTSRAGIGKMAILKRPGATNQGFQSLVLKDGYSCYFIYSMGNIIKAKAEAIASGSTFLEISGKTLGSLNVLIPSEEEQNVISTLFEHIDTLITLHRRKCEQLETLKKSMLEKLFPKEGELVPELRFAGFAGDWERRKFSDIFTFLQNNTLSRAELSETGDGAKNIHYGDILVRFGECVNVSIEPLPTITNKDTINKYHSSCLQNGDIVIADTAEDGTVGKCSEVIGVKGETILSGLHTIPCRPAENYAEGFLGYYLNSSAYHDQLIPLMQGIKVTSISKSSLQTTDILCPRDLDEQAGVSTFLIKLDTLLTLYRRKLERLQNTKKACLEKMFV